MRSAEVVFVSKYSATNLDLSARLRTASGETRAGAFDVLV
jgi:hypothetical protein